MEKALATIKLFDEEKVIEQAVGKYEKIKRISATEIVVEHKCKGFLFLTTDRLMFISRNHSLDLRLYYENIMVVEAETVIDNYLQIITNTREVYRFKVKSVSDEELSDKIQAMIAEKVSLLAKEQKSERVQLVLDFSFLRPLVEKGIVMKVLRCPYCGGKIDNLPLSGDFFNCTYCGHKIYATDIHKEINRLLGYTVEKIPEMTTLDTDKVSGDKARAEAVKCRYFENDMCKNLMGSKLAFIRVADGCRNLNYASCCLICSRNTRCDINCSHIY